MRQRHLPTLGLSWSHRPTLGPGIWTGSCGNGIFQLSVCGKQLQYCRKRETAITTTAPVLEREREKNCNYYDRCSIYCRERERNRNYYDRSSIADWEKLQLQRPLQYCRERNCNYYDRSSIAEREKLQLLRPLQYCKLGETAITSTAPVLQKKRTCNYYDRSSIAETERERERKTALTTTAPVLQRERSCNSCDPSSMANREKLQVLRPLQCCRDKETATITTAPNQKLEGCKLGRIQSWKMCFIPTVGCWNLGCASSNFAAAYYYHYHYYSWLPLKSRGARRQGFGSSMPDPWNSWAPHDSSIRVSGLGV